MRIDECEWLCGYAAALATIARCGSPDLVEEAMEEDELTVDDLDAAGADEEDLAEIVRALG